MTHGGFWDTPTGILPSLLARRWIVVLVAYLDDSGKDPQNRVTTVAGYVAKDTAWAAFEAEVEPIFARYGMSIGVQI